jgi:predicted hotdog family 3-hydroxylacyl-ACP dehydratase
MIDGILAAEGPLTRTGLEVRPDNIFVENGRLMPPGLMENIAQTAAARVGYQALLDNTPVPLGFIGAVKDLEIFELPPAGAFIETVTTIQHQVMNATMVSGEVTLNGKVMARCEMKIFVNPVIPK